MSLSQFQKHQLSNIKKDEDVEYQKVPQDIWEKFSNTMWIDVKNANRKGTTAALRVGENEIFFATFLHGHAKTKVKPNQANFIRFRIGSNILKEMNWKEDDYIFVGQSPHCLMQFYLTKTDNSRKGFKLKMAGGVHSVSHGIFNFAFPKNEIMPHVTKTRPAEFFIFKKQEAIMVICDDTVKPHDAIV